MDASGSSCWGQRPWPGLGGSCIGLAWRWNFAFAPTTTQHEDEPMKTKQASRVDKTTNHSVLPNHATDPKVYIT